MNWVHEIAIIKRDGRVFHVANAVVQETNIVFQNESIPVESGDMVNHQLPCAVDRYVILRTGKSSTDPAVDYVEVARKG